jgi:sensor c-di-GMP phosphodiesterase-like protein
MKKLFIAFILFIGLLATPSYAHGDNTTILQQVPSVKLQVPGKISPMNEGDRAPFSGVLFSIEAAVFVLAQPQHNAEMIQIEVLNAQQIERAQCKKQVADKDTQLKADKTISQAEIDEATKRIAILTEKIKEDESKNTPNVWLWASGGVVVGTLATFATIYAAQHL